MGKERLTKAQRWTLSLLADGQRVLPAGGYEIHTSFYSGERWYGAPHAAYSACKKRGWIQDQSITSAGRAALKES